MDDGRLNGQEDKLYVVISYDEDMQIFICNRDVFLLRLSQKYGVPTENIGLFDTEAPIPAPLIGIKDVRDGMILEMVDKLKFFATSSFNSTGKASEQVPVFPILEEANIPGALPSKEDNIPVALLPKEETNIHGACASSPKDEVNISKEAGALMPSILSTNEGNPRFKKVKISFRSSKDAGSNLTKIEVKKILFL